MYLGSDRMFYFAGENVVQDFNNTAPAYQRDSTKGHLDESLNMSHFSKSVQIRDPEVDRDERPKRQSSMKRKEETREPPRDLGENFVRVLLDEFKRVRQINTKDPKVLLEFWKMNRKTRQKETDVLNKSMRGTARSEKSFISQGSQTSERIRELQAISREREEDVVYTLDVHSEVLKQEENMKKFILDAYRQRKMEDELKRTQKPKKMSKETLDRLYKAPPPKSERPMSATQSTRAGTMQTTVKSKYDKEFVQKLVDLHAEARPTERRYLDQDRLFSFWQGLSNKQEHKLYKNEGSVKDDLEAYFEEKYDAIEDIYSAKYGYRTYDHKALLNFYKNEVSDGEKKRKEIDYDTSALEKPLEKYCAKRKKEREEFEKKMEEEYRQKDEEEKAKLSKCVIRKEIKSTGLEKLAKPKDNLMRGKTMLLLKKVFPQDRILQRMIINEFKKNKLLKYPEEYDVYDSDDEIDVYKRDELREPFKTIAKEGRALKIQDLSKPINEREKEITEPFKKYLQQKYFDSNLKIEEEKDRKKGYEKGDKQLDRFITGRVRAYLQMRKKRLSEKIPTLKEFLIQTYRSMRSSFKEATDRRFPHITYGYSKRLKQNSYPVEFKRHFFSLVKAISRGNKMSHGKSLLPFWAPPSAGSKAYNALNTNISYNKRINELSRQNRIKKVEEDIDRTNCWQKEEFLVTRLNIMMTLSDAKECTFTPTVGSKMPKKYKELMQQEYAAWSNQYLTQTKASFDEWVNAMGNNLSRRFPTIYKYGKFKKAIRHWKEDQYIRAYKEIAEVFNINSIKKHFNPEFNASTFKTVMFSRENLKLEDEGHKPQEDFNDAANAKFLEDVYMLIMFLESHEKELKKSIKEVKGMLAQDKLKRRMRDRSEKAKTMMCPLHGECPEDIRPRWPTSGTKTISKFGKKCEFAHHVFELKFEEEMQAKKDMLKQTLDHLGKKLESDYQRTPFNPGGGVFTNCIGCGEGISKGACATCQLRKGVSKKLQAYRQKAATKYLRITQKGSFKEHYHEKHDFNDKINTKMGYYRKACVLYDKERYADAFKNIAKAVEMVKNEKRSEEEKEHKKSNEVKAKLGIDPSIPLTMDMLYDLDKKDNGGETDRSLEDTYGLSRAKLIAYAEKMGYIGDQKVDVNEFLNYQIQEIYVKIEKKLQSKLKDIDMLQKKIERLEGFEEEEEQAQIDDKANGLTETLAAKRRKERKLIPKSKYDIDLVTDEKRIENMQKTIQFIRSEIEESRPPEPWRPTKHENIILDIDKYDSMMSSKNQKKVEGEKPKDLSMTAKSGKMNDKSIYNRDLDELVKMPFERASPTKY